MNLVQINERLKDLPPQVLQQYADGMNPEVPPYLALGEMQRRELALKRMATAQGGQQGPQPSVKEQIEQKAGLMAAQAMQQQQMMQQMAQPRGPMPAPAGVPQPEAQPQPPMMAARGGLARAPVRFDFQHGGIVAFSNGGGARVHPQAELIEFLKKMGLTPEEFTKAPPKVQNEIRDMMRAGVQAAAPTPPSATPTAQAAKSNLFRSVNPAGIAGYGFGLYHGDLGAGEEAELERRRQMAPTLTERESAMTGTMPRENQKYKVAPGDAGEVYTSSIPDIGKVGERFFYTDAEGNLRVMPREQSGRRLSDQEFNEGKKRYNAQPDITSQGPGDVFAPRYPQSGLPAAPSKNSSGAPSKVNSAAPIADLKALDEQKQQQKQQQAARPASAATPGTTTPTPENPQAEVARLALDANRNVAKAMTPEEAMAQERKFAAQYGLDKPFGEEERGLLAAMKQRQAQYAAGRPMSELSAVLRGFGQGYGGAGAAGERASQETFNADMAHQREMLNAINALNKTNLETGRERYKTSGNLFGEDQKSTAADNRARAQTLGSMSNQYSQSQTQMRGQDIQKEVAQINARANAAGRPFNIVEQTFNRIKTGDPKKDAEILQNLAKEFAEYKKPGIDIAQINAFTKTNEAMFAQLRREKAMARSNPEKIEQAQRTLNTLRQAAISQGLDPNSIPDLVANTGTQTAAPTGKVPPPPPGFTPDKS